MQTRRNICVDNSFPLCDRVLTAVAINSCLESWSVKASLGGEMSSYPSLSVSDTSSYLNIYPPSQCLARRLTFFSPLCSSSSNPKSRRSLWPCSNDLKSQMRWVSHLSPPLLSYIFPFFHKKKSHISTLKVCVPHYSLWRSVWEMFIWQLCKETADKNRAEICVC